MADALPVTTLKTPAGTLGQFGQRQRGKRRLLGRLEDDGTTGSQRRCNLAGNHRRGEIPRRDGGANTNRFLDDDQLAIPERRWNDFAVGALGFLGEPLNVGSSVGDLAARLGQRLALLCGHEAGEVFLVRHQQVEPATQDAAALGGGGFTPGFQGLVGGGDGALGFGGAATGDGGDGFAGGRVGDIDRLAAIGWDPSAVDVAGLAEQGGVG